MLAWANKIRACGSHFPLNPVERTLTVNTNTHTLKCIRVICLHRHSIWFYKLIRNSSNFKYRNWIGFEGVWTLFVWYIPVLETNTSIHITFVIGIESTFLRMLIRYYNMKQVYLDKPLAYSKSNTMYTFISCICMLDYRQLTSIENICGIARIHPESGWKLTNKQKSSYETAVSKIELFGNVIATTNTAECVWKSEMSFHMSGERVSSILISAHWKLYTFYRCNSRLMW